MPHVNPLASLKENKKQIPSTSSGGLAVQAHAPTAQKQISDQDDVREGFGELFLLNDRVNQLLLEYLDPKALRQAQGRLWRAKPPGVGGGVRTTAAIFTHMHNVRRKWLRLSAPHLKLPPELDRTQCTQKQAAAALAESAQLCAEMIAEAVSPDGRVKQFVRDGWARPWNLEDTAGAVKMLAYMVSHEAHHRGQVCMLAHQMGYRLPMKVMARMWAWEGDSPSRAKALRAKKTD
jgi:uncharacterized damage-inducible protein DinB